MSTEWHDDSNGSRNGSERWFYGFLDSGGSPDTHAPYVEIIRDSVEGVVIGPRYIKSMNWCYAYDGDACPHWIEMPESVTSVDEAKAYAMTVWRMS